MIASFGSFILGPLLTLSGPNVIGLQMQITCSGISLVCLLIALTLHDSSRTNAT
ncbi:MAG: hypothetical protein AAGJ83_10965 [Planctomycetota bacterium]